MRTATARDLRNTYGKLLDWVEAGEEVVIRRGGRTVARLVPDVEPSERRLAWSASAALSRDKKSWRKLERSEVATVLDEAGGRW